MLLHISTYSAIYLSVFLIWSLVDMSLSWRSRLCVRGRLTWSAAPPCPSGTRLFHGARSASSMEDIIAKNMQEEGIDPRATILLCVSAGSDSMAMLHLLQAVKQRLFQQLDLHVVNFNHKARKESDEEAVFVGQWCSQYRLPYHTREFPMEERNSKSAFQDRARKWRQAECQSILKNIDNVHGKYVATAHHRDDQVETMLMKIIRGAHITNLSPMKVVQGNYFKPMLSSSKASLVDYLTANNYTWHEDASNQLNIYKRNKVRLDLIPLLEELAGSKDALERRMMSLSRQSTEVSDLLHTLEQRNITSPVWKMRHLQDYYHTLELTKAQRKRLVSLQLSHQIHKWVQQVTGVSLQSDVMEDVMALFDKLKNRKSVSATISDHWDIAWLADELRLVPRFYKSPEKTSSIASTSGKVVTVRHPSFIKVAPGQQLTLKISAKSVDQGLVCRLLADGDSLKKKASDGMVATKKLKDTFRQLSSAERDRVVVITDREGCCLAALTDKTVVLADNNSTDNDVEVQLSVELLFSNT